MILNFLESLASILLEIITPILLKKLLNNISIIKYISKKISDAFRFLATISSVTLPCNHPFVIESIELKNTQINANISFPLSSFISLYIFLNSFILFSYLYFPSLKSPSFFRQEKILLSFSKQD